MKKTTTRQAQHIKPEALEKTAQMARQRAIEVRRQGVKAALVRSNYNLGGWRGLFDDRRECSEKNEGPAELAQQNQPEPLTSSSQSSATPSDSTTMPLCPSGRPESPDGVVFGVVGGTPEAPQVIYLNQPQPITEEIRSLANSVTPTEIFRTAASCAAKGCLHFDGSHCRLAMRVVANLPTVVDALPACQIRPQCRWWQQEGKAACLRCPQIVTDDYNPSELVSKEILS